MHLCIKCPSALQVPGNALCEIRNNVGSEIVRNCEVEMTSTARKRILCVEDDEDTREMMNALLGEYGYEPVIATTVPDALEISRSGGLALCILDHWIPEGDGVELCRQIRAFDSSTPILFYSGAGYVADIQSGLAAGAQAYLVKPDFDHLLPTIGRLIDEADSKQFNCS
jgi:DNA-binding response OmpR family regulator